MFDFRFRASTALTYFSVQSSFLLVVITYGLMPALGSGLAYASPLVNSMKVNETFLTFCLLLTKQWRKHLNLIELEPQQRAEACHLCNSLITTQCYTHFDKSMSDNDDQVQ